MPLTSMNIGWIHVTAPHLGTASHTVAVEFPPAAWGGARIGISEYSESTGQTAVAGSIIRLRHRLPSGADQTEGVNFRGAAWHANLSSVTFRLFVVSGVAEASWTIYRWD